MVVLGLRSPSRSWNHGRYTHWEPEPWTRPSQVWRPWEEISWSFLLLALSSPTHWPNPAVIQPIQEPAGAPIIQSRAGEVKAWAEANRLRPSQGNT